MSFRKHLLELDPNLIVESNGDETMDSQAVLVMIKEILLTMSDDEIDEFGVFLAVEFFDEDIEELDGENGVYFTYQAVLEMIDALGEESYEFILDLLLPEEIDNDDSEYIEYDMDDLYGSEADTVADSLDEGVSRVMKVNRANKKKRKFFAKSAATLRKERAQRLKDNRLTKASRKAYQRVNKAKIKSYQKSRATFIKKGRHFTKVRRKSGE